MRLTRGRVSFIMVVWIGKENCCLGGSAAGQRSRDTLQSEGVSPDGEYNGKLLATSKNRPKECEREQIQE